MVNHQSQLWIIHSPNLFVMKQNMGTADRIIRMLAATAIAVLYFTHFITGVAGLVLMVFAVVFFLTSLIGFCPLYTLLGITTCRTKREKAPGV
jgi:hypothetical protein